MMAKEKKSSNDGTAILVPPVEGAFITASLTKLVEEIRPALYILRDGAQPLVIGRPNRSNLGDQATIAVCDRPYVSRMHAKIDLVEGTWVITDLDSTNGTYVNRNRVYGSLELKHGDIIALGQRDEAMFLFETVAENNN